MEEKKQFNNQCYNGQDCANLPNCKKNHPKEHYEQYFNNQMDQQEQSQEDQYQDSVNNLAQQINQRQYKQIKIGIDFGNVICGSDPYAPKDPNEDTMFSENYLNTPMIQDSFTVIKYLIEKYGSDNIYIVSKCGEKVQKKSIHWMENKQFIESTGFKIENRLFCRERKEKGIICKNNGINIFIDDRQDVLNHIDNSVTKILFPSQGKQVQKSKNWINVINWNHIKDVVDQVK